MRNQKRGNPGRVGQAGLSVGQSHTRDGKRQVAEAVRVARNKSDVRRRRRLGRTGE